MCRYGRGRRVDGRQRTIPWRTRYQQIGFLHRELVLGVCQEAFTL